MDFDTSIWRNFLQKHDMVFQVPPEEWERGLPMGNSIVSTVTWGSNPIKITLDRSDIWETRSAFHPDPETFKWSRFCEKFEQGRGDQVSEFYQTEKGPTPQQIPLGRFEIRLKGQSIQHYHMRLCLYDGVSTGGYQTELGGIEWRSYICANAPVVVFEYRLSGDETADIRFRFVSKLGEYTADMEQAKKTGASCRAKKNMGMFITGYADAVPEFAQVMKDWGYPDPTFSQTEDVSFYEQTIPENGNYAVAWQKICLGKGHFALVVSIVTDRQRGQAELLAVQEIRKAASSKTLAQRLAENCDWWHAFYPKSFFSIPDTKLEGLYWLQMYILGCTARPEGNPMTIGGIWTPDDGLAAFCANDFHWNMQQQGNLWPIYTSNHLEAGFSTYDMIERGRPAMAQFCEQFFDCKGEFLTHCSDLDCRPLYINQDQFEFCSLPWVCQLFWLHYKFTMDDHFLRERTYPLMKEAVRPLLKQLKPDNQGVLHLPWSSSPEYHGEQETFRFALEEEPDWKNRFGPDATIDLAFIRFLCEALLETVNILDIQDPEAQLWAHTLQNLAPFSLDRFGGLMVRADLALTSSHRHFSHMFPIYPLHQMTYDNPKDRKIIDRSMLVLTALGHGEWMGWSFPNMAALCVRSGRIAQARMLMMDFVDKILNENGFHMQGCNQNSELIMHQNYGMTVEAPLMAASVLLDMVCCSYNGELHIFTFTPHAWDDVSFWNLRGEGAFLISAQRRAGKTEFIRVISEKGGVCHLVSPLWEQVCVRMLNHEVPYTRKADHLEFITEAGGEYWITEPHQDIAECTIQPVSSIPTEENFFGLKKRPRH